MKTFSVKQLEVFRSIKERQGTVEAQRLEARAQYKHVVQQLKKANDECRSIKRQLAGEFAQLAKLDIFSIPTPTVNAKHAKAKAKANKYTKPERYIYKAEKLSIFNKIVADFKYDNPGTKVMLYSDIRKALPAHNVKTYQLATFFCCAMSQYAKVGTHHDRGIIIRK